jgi:hypothetical protein
MPWIARTFAPVVSREGSGGYSAAIVVHAERSMNMNGARESGIPAPACAAAFVDSSILGFVDFVAKGGNGCGS